MTPVALAFAGGAPITALATDLFAEPFESDGAHVAFAAAAGYFVSFLPSKH